MKINSVTVRNTLLVSVLVLVQFTLSSDAASCQLDSDCTNGELCCGSVFGKIAGTCYDPVASRCCAIDGNIAPFSTNLTDVECCTYDSDSGSVTHCPTDSPKCSATESGAACTQTCVSESCDNGFCCYAPASKNNFDGRCYSAGQTCCFDGRICPNDECNIPEGGQCCGVNLDQNEYSYCEAGYYCNVVSGAITCTTYPYGSNSTDSGSSQDLSLGSGSSAAGWGSSSHRNSHIGLIVGIAVPVGILIVAIVVVVSLVLWRRNKPKKSDKIVEPTVPPVYQASSYMTTEKTTTIVMPPAYNAPANGGYEPMSDPQSLYEKPPAPYVEEPTSSPYEKMAA